jgi:hypothetical protein
MGTVMKNTILIISDNLPYAKSLARAFAGNPLAPILSKHGGHFSILCPQMDDEIAQIAYKSTIRLVIVGSEAGADMFNWFVRLQRDGIIPRGVGLIVLGGLVGEVSATSLYKEVMQDSFTLDFPVNLDELAKLIDAALERPPSEWIKSENAAINRQRYSELYAQVRSLKHRFEGQISSRSIRLANLEQCVGEVADTSLYLSDKSEKLRRLITGRHPQEMWMQSFLREFDELRTPNPEFSQNAGLKMRCDDVQCTLQLLSEVAQSVPTDTLTEEQISTKSNEFKNAMNAVVKTLKSLLDFPEEESVK